MRFIMHVVEFTLPTPTPLDRRFRLEPHLRGATARIFEPGDKEDITSPLWNNRTHKWHLSVRTDGIGVLTITPVSRIAAILLLGRQSEVLGAVTHTLTRPVRHVLAGTQLIDGDGTQVTTVFKAVCALEDSDRLMRWIADSHPRKIFR